MVQGPTNLAPQLRRWAAVLALTAAYFAAGKFGLSLAVVHASASAVWPPTGVAFAALLLWGYGLWPGVFLGAFLVNSTIQGDLITSLPVAAGNTLEALLGVWFVVRFANGPKVFERARNIFKFVLLAALASTLVSATIGTTTLSLSGYAAWDRFGSIWLTWWLGDISGDLIIAPLLVIWLRQPKLELDLPTVLEAVLLTIVLLLTAYAVFFGEVPLGLAYVIILPLLWAAFRFGQRGAVAGAFLTAAIALAGTVSDLGPFVGRDPNESLLYLQGFTATIAVTALVLASVLSERGRAEQRLEVQEAVSRVLADSPDANDAVSKIMRILCERAKWSAGAIWNPDGKRNELVCIDFWHLPSLAVPLFEAASRKRKFTPGEGLPGRVWRSAEAVWIADVTRDENFPRAPIALKEGLRAAFGVPIKVAEEVVAVIECFSREVREPDEDFLRIVGDMGVQLGRFIERKRAEAKLLQSEKDLADFFDTAPESLHWVAPDGTILRANEAELKMLGYSADEYIGRHIAEFHVGRALIGDILSRLRRGEVLRDFPAQMRCKDGSIRDVLITSSVYWRNGEFVHTRCFTRDVTELKRAEEARAMLAAIVQSSDDAIVSKDLDGIITSWNPGAERLFGYRAEEMIGQSILRIIPPDYHDQETLILAQLTSGQRIDPLETVRVTRDGRRLDISLTVSPIKNSDGVVIGGSKIARDISARKRSEELLRHAQQELLQANDQLEKRVRERTADLEQANLALRENLNEQKRLEEQLRQAQKMESIGTLAGGIAHDFNNTLNIIRGYAMLLTEECAGKQESAAALAVIHDEIDRGAAVVRQLLTLARKTETLLQPTDPNQVVSRVTELIQQTFPKTIKIELKLQQALPPVLADANQLTQALLNICVNARDAMPGGGEITVSTASIEEMAMRARYAEASAHPHVCIAISDTGLGIEESIRPRIFEPFFSTKGFGQGTGLGLAMVYGIVKNHRGFVAVESEPGRGATFLIYLPTALDRHENVTAVLPKRAAAADPARRAATILIVEDEQAMIRLLTDGLAQAGYRSLAAIDGEEALDLYARHKDQLTLVLMDLGLPKITGSEVIRTIKAETPQVPVIVTTGYLEPELKSELLNRGVTEYIHKPYLVEDVLRTIDEVLSRF